MTNATPLTCGASGRLARIDARLESANATPEAELGNQRHPLDEAIYIILSFQTDLSRLGTTWSGLRAAYPSWRALGRADARDVAHVLRHGRLHRQKARSIRRLLTSVRNVAGAHSLNLLRAMSDADAERLLVSLPGLSWKAVRCVLLYGVDRHPLPIDSNTFRVLTRTGVLSRRAGYRRRKLHDGIQAAVAPHRRRAPHVSLVVHGRRRCLPRGPRCPFCPLMSDCPKVGLPAGARRVSPAPSGAAATARHAFARGHARA